jgi:hypothetical protein
MFTKAWYYLIIGMTLHLSFSCSKQDLANHSANVDNLHHPDSSFLPVIFLCGQSNMEGVAVDATLAENFKNTIPNAHIFFKPTITSDNNGTIQTLQYGINNNWRDPKIHFGPEAGMAYYLTKSGHKIAIVKYAYGGSKLSEVGSPDDNGYWQVNATASLKHYSILINNWATQSILAFRKAGYKPYIAAFVWCQGETDAHDLLAANEYETNLRQLLDNFKKDLYQTDSLIISMRVIITRTRNNFSYSGKIRKAQENIANTYLNTYLIDSDKWPLLKDNIHFTATTEAELHGKSIADILSRVIP